MIVYIDTKDLSDETIMKIAEESGIEGKNSHQIVDKLMELTKTIQETHEIMLKDQIVELIANAGLQGSNS